MRSNMEILIDQYKEKKNKPVPDNNPTEVVRRINKAYDTVELSCPGDNIVEQVTEYLESFSINISAIADVKDCKATLVSDAMLPQPELNLAERAYRLASKVVLHCEDKFDPQSCIDDLLLPLSTADMEDQVIMLDFVSMMVSYDKKVNMFKGQGIKHLKNSYLRLYEKIKEASKDENMDITAEKDRLVGIYNKDQGQYLINIWNELLIAGSLGLNEERIEAGLLMAGSRLFDYSPKKEIRVGKFDYKVFSNLVKPNENIQDMPTNIRELEEAYGKVLGLGYSRNTAKMPRSLQLITASGRYSIKFPGALDAKEENCAINLIYQAEKNKFGGDPQNQKLTEDTNRFIGMGYLTDKTCR